MLDPKVPRAHLDPTVALAQQGSLEPEDLPGALVLLVERVFLVKTEQLVSRDPQVR